MKIIPLLFTLSIGYLPIQEQDIEVNPIHPTPFNDNVQILIDNVYTIRRGEAINLRLRSHAIGSNTYSESMEGMRMNPLGATVLLIFNGKYRVYVGNADCKPMVEQFAYFNRECQVTVPDPCFEDLVDGKFVLHAIALNSYNESVKAKGGMTVKVLDYGYSTPADTYLLRALREPYLLYNQPMGEFYFGEPVLLDFYLNKGFLSKDGDKVELFIDGEKTAVLTDWVPYEIVGLLPGPHTIRLVLVNTHGEPYPSPFTVQENTIFVK